MPFTSARIRTKGKGDWVYGRFEVCAKVPPFRRGVWPAICDDADRLQVLALAREQRDRHPRDQAGHNVRDAAVSCTRPQTNHRSGEMHTISRLTCGRKLSPNPPPGHPLGGEERDS